MRFLTSLAFLLAFSFNCCGASSQERTPTAGHAEAGRRVALVIGNGAYPGAAALRNPANDARDMAQKLKRLGFQVIARTDLKQKDMLRALTEFGDQIVPGSEVLFFYAGHGMQVRGKNYLIPVDAEIRIESAVSSEAVDVDQLLDKLSPARLSMVILDACRNNPFERRFRGGGQGLAQISAPTGTLIAYATSPGRVAADGEGRNGLFTGELLAAMDIPGIKIEDVFKRVRSNVVRKSHDAQTPWESSSLTGDFYFQPPAGGQSSAAPPVSSGQDSAALELAFWDSIKNSTNEDDFRAYLDRFPSGVFAPLAQRQLERRRDSPASLQGRWVGETAAFIAAAGEDALRLTGTMQVTPAEVRIDYTTWGPRFSPQDVPMELSLRTTAATLGGTWKRSSFKAGTCEIPAEEGTVEGVVAASGDQITLRFATGRYTVQISRQMLWEDECKKVEATGSAYQDLVLKRSASGR
ncbi:MAG: caspase family protein [Sterolibacteriaceae bacterium MAG5]|nr:caspase family protein [Candidatus Nitricoxidireducens bremensis]